MMPLVFANPGEENIVRKLGGSPEVRQHLADLGFNVGADVTIVNAIGGNVIVKIKESRVAISREMAQKIMIYGEARRRRHDNKFERNQNRQYL